MHWIDTTYSWVRPCRGTELLKKGAVFLLKNDKISIGFVISTINKYFVVLISALNGYYQHLNKTCEDTELLKNDDFSTAQCQNLCEETIGCLAYTTNCFFALISATIHTWMVQKGTELKKKVDLSTA